MRKVRIPGAFAPGDTPAHRIDARAKIVLLLVASIASFAASAPFGLLLVAVGLEHHRGPDLVWTGDVESGLDAHGLPPGGDVHEGQVGDGGVHVVEECSAHSPTSFTMPMAHSIAALESSSESWGSKPTSYMRAQSIRRCLPSPLVFMTNSG